MTKIGKLLAVFVATASLAFAGFAIVTIFAGPDFESMTNARYLEYYSFSRGPAPDFLWTATRVADGGQVASSKKLPEVLTKVLDEISTKQQKELQDLNEREPILKTRVESLEAAKAADEAALADFEVRKREQLATSRLEQAEVATKIIAATNESQQLENLTVVRREDVLRLKQQIAEVRTDEYRLLVSERELKNLLIQFQGDQNRAKARQDSLQQQLQ